MENVINMMVKSGHYTRGYAAAMALDNLPLHSMVPHMSVSNSSIGILEYNTQVVMGAVHDMNSLIAIKRGYEYEGPVPLQELPKITFNAFPAIIPILMIILLLWVCTPTEAAAVAALCTSIFIGHYLFNFFIEFN